MMVVVPIEQVIVLMLIEVLVMIKEIVRMNMIEVPGSLMMEIHYSLVLKKRKDLC